MEPRSIRALVWAAAIVAGMLFSPAASHAGYQFVRSFAPQGSDTWAQGIAANGGGVLVSVDSVDHFDLRAIQVFSSLGTYEGQIGGAEAPNGVATDSQGDVFLADGFSGLIGEYGSNSGYSNLNQGNPAGISSFLSLAADDLGDLWVADGSGHVTTFFAADGDLLNQFAIPGLTQIPGHGLSAQPSGIAVDQTGYVYVALTSNGGNPAQNDVLVFWQDGSFVRQIGSAGSGDGQFSSTGGVAFDGVSKLYVSDSGNNRVEVFDTGTGQYLGQFGSFGTGDGQFQSPGGVAADSYGNVWVIDSGGHRIQEFQVVAVPEPGSLILLTLGLVFWLGRYCLGRR